MEINPYQSPVDVEDEIIIAKIYGKYSNKNEHIGLSINLFGVLICLFVIYFNYSIEDIIAGWIFLPIHLLFFISSLVRILKCK